MKKIDPTILKETLYIFIWVLGLSAIMQVVFLIIEKWDYTVILGNLLTGFAVTLNFFLMGLGVQKSLGKDEKGAKKTIRISQAYRYLILIAVLVIGVAFPSVFNIWTVFIPVVFPRIAIAVRPFFNKKDKNAPSEVVENAEDQGAVAVEENNQDEVNDMENSPSKEDEVEQMEE